MRHRDDGSTHVLEAIILALILLGAAYSVTTLRANSVENGRPRAHLERVAHDAMVILSGLQDANGSLLDAYLQEAFHCAADPVPSETSCDGTRSANLSLKIESYLPAGAGYAIGLDNGVANQDLYRSVLAPGETVSATFTYVPSWNFTFLVPELSCYEAGMDANVTAVPLRRGALAPVPAFALKGGADKAATTEASSAPGLWNASFAAADVAGLGVVRAQASDRFGMLPGAVSLSTCDLGGLGGALVDALHAAPFAPAADVVAVGGQVSFASDLRDLLALTGATLVEANVTLYEPIPPRGTEPDTYLPAHVLDLGTAAEGAALWDVPPSARLGAHPVVLRAALALPNGGEVEVRRVDTIQVALPDGTVPIAPPYRAVLQVWFSDWR